MDILQAAATAIDLHHLIAPGAAIVVAVSGGADSVALLSVLRELAGKGGRGYRLIVAHLNHCLRAEAVADAEFVKDLARACGLEFVLGRQDVKACATATSQSVEQAARQLRYEFLLTVANEAGAAAVAVAHHADDNAETVLYRLLRGSSLHGLRGIPIRRALLNSPIQLVRPLLACRRADIESYCRSQGLTWREDASNADTSYRRNFIRHQLLPQIRQNLNPQAEAALLRLAEHAAEVDGLLAAQAQQLLDQAHKKRDQVFDLKGGICHPFQVKPLTSFGGQWFGRSEFTSNLAGSLTSINHDRRDDGEIKSSEDNLKARSAPDIPPQVTLSAKVMSAAASAVQAYALRQVLERLGMPMRDVGMQQISELRQLLSSETGAICCGNGFEARREGDSLVLHRVSHVCTAQKIYAPHELAVPGTAQLPDGSRIECSIEPWDAAGFVEYLSAAKARHAELAKQLRDPDTAALPRRHVELLDGDQVHGPLVIRQRLVGDHFHPLGSAGTKSVSDFVTDLKLPAHLRGQLWCLCDQAGIIALWPVRIDHRVRLAERTRRVLRVESQD